MRFERFQSSWTPLDTKTHASNVCTKCQSKYQEGDIIFIFDDCEICESCFEKWLHDQFIHDPEGLAKKLNVGTWLITAEDLEPDEIAGSLARGLGDCLEKAGYKERS